MLRKMLSSVILGGVFVLLSFSAGAAGEVTSGKTKITRIGTGWNADVVSVALAITIPNPGGCTKNDIIIIDTTTAGYKTHYAALLSAHVSQSDVQVVIAGSGCLYDRPILAGVFVY